MRKTMSLDALFPKTRQAILAAILIDPARSWYLSDLAAISGSLHRAFRESFTRSRGVGFFVAMQMVIGSTSGPIPTVRLSANFEESFSRQWDLGMCSRNAWTPFEIEFGWLSYTDRWHGLKSDPRVTWT